MAKICFYCGKELQSGEHCTCSGSAARNSSSTHASSQSTHSKNSREEKGRKQSKDEERVKRERNRKAAQREAEQRQKATSKANQRPRSGFLQRLALKLLSGNSFKPGDPLHSKIGYSILQSLVRPASATHAFVRNNDVRLSVFYLLLFSVSFGLFNMRLSGFSMVNFAEGTLLGLVFATLLNTALLLVFRFLAKVRYSFSQLLTAFCAPSVFFSLFFLLAASGQVSTISLVLTVMAGISAGGILHFLSLKALTGRTDEQLAMNIIFAYFIFFSFAGFILSILLALPAGSAT